MASKYLKSNNASIYINDVDINDYNNEAIEKDISYISQSELVIIYLIAKYQKKKETQNKDTEMVKVKNNNRSLQLM